MDDSEVQDVFVGHSCNTTMNNNTKNRQDIDPSSFYRIIIPPVFYDGKLGLPQDFIKEYGNELSTTVRLRVPTGGIWHVRIERAESKIWLREGWQRFAEHHSIRFGYFLLFKYNGKSEFDVGIFDLTTTEIEYPCSIDSNKIFSHVAESTGPEQDKLCGHSDDQPIEILDSSETEEDITLDSGGTCSKGKNWRRTGRRGLSDEEKMWELHIATRIFKSDNPYFSTTMRRYNLGASFVMHVPAEFSRTYLSGRRDFIELQDSDTNKWRVRTIPKQGRILLSKGWSNFVKEKELCLGDVCVFELIKSTHVGLKVSIFRAKDRAEQLN